MSAITVVRHPRARRYVLRLDSEGGLRLTVPRRASVEGGLKFVQGQQKWIDRERARMAERAQPWAEGTEIWWRGERIRLSLSADGHAIQCGEQQIRCIDQSSQMEARAFRPGLWPDLKVRPSRTQGQQPSLFDTPNLRPVVETHLRRVASRELPPRCLEFARAHGVTVTRVFVRNQRSRWGACSSTGTITLNWRLLQMPQWVADYVILHELMHRRQPNHSVRYWREVASVCREWREAERWIRKNGRSIL